MYPSGTVRATTLSHCLRSHPVSSSHVVRSTPGGTVPGTRLSVPETSLLVTFPLHWGFVSDPLTCFGSPAPDTRRVGLLLRRHSRTFFHSKTLDGSRLEVLLFWGDLLIPTGPVSPRWEGRVAGERRLGCGGVGPPESFVSTTCPDVHILSEF